MDSEKTLIELLGEKHKDWIHMAKSFKISDEDANELVQEMYVRISKYIENQEKIMYNSEELNTYYIYVTLRNLFLSNYHKYNKANHFLLENEDDFIDSPPDMEVEDLFDGLVNSIDKQVTKWYWYDKKIWNIHFYSKMSMRKIARETKISLSSIFNTLSNGKSEVREKTLEKYKEYKKNKK